MTMEDYIEANRDHLKECVLGAVPNAQYLDDEELELWILNDEYLYEDAERAGVFEEED